LDARIYSAPTANTDDSNHNYWLFDWLERRRISDVSKLHAVLDSRSSLEEMRESALGWKGKVTRSKSEFNLVAGSGLGLYDGLSCRKSSCIAGKINVLYRHAWHYFDYIYLPDAAGDLLRNSRALDDADLEDLSHLVESSMYIRNLGAQSLTRYYSSDAVITSSSKLLKSRKPDGIWAELYNNFLQHPERFEVTNLGRDSYEISYSDPELRFEPLARLNLKSVPKSQRRNLLRSLLAEDMVNRHRSSFTTDILAAKQLGGSLGSTIWSHQWALSKAAKRDDIGGIFFRMEFPSLQNVPVEDLVLIRLEHRDSFLACRTALRKAVNELSASISTDRDALSDEVVRDVVSPEIARLSNKLDAARKVLGKKSAVALTIAGVSTWCGVHFGLGMAASLGAGALAAFGTGFKDAAFKYAEENRDLEISDMSFLWKAMKCVDK
jgi:hypothetical protein